jgi:hypothetical protein
MGTVARSLRLLVLALLVDAVIPSVGAFTVKVVAELESEPVASLDPSVGCPVENEVEPARTEGSLQISSETRRFATEDPGLAEGHPPPPFRPPIAA